MEENSKNFAKGMQSSKHNAEKEKTMREGYEAQGDYKASHSVHKEVDEAFKQAHHSDTKSGIDVQGSTNMEIQYRALEEEKQKMQNALLRAHADLENVRRRHKEEMQNAADYSITKLLHDLIEVVESLYKAQEHLGSVSVPSGGDGHGLKGLAEGINMTVKIMENVLTKHGVERIKPKSKVERFDHNYHEAISYVNSAEVQKDIIMDVIAAGYLVKQRLLKPATVIVSRGES